MNGLDTRAVEAFIVKAKANIYVGGGQKSPACRPFSHDLLFHEGSFSILIFVSQVKMVVRRLRLPPVVDPWSEAEGSGSWIPP